MERVEAIHYAFRENTYWREYSNELYIDWSGSADFQVPALAIQQLRELVGDFNIQIYHEGQTGDFSVSIVVKLGRGEQSHSTPPELTDRKE